MMSDERMPQALKEAEASYTRQLPYQLAYGFVHYITIMYVYVYLSGNATFIIPQTAHL
jgi:hypothetical protein